MAIKGRNIRQMFKEVGPENFRAHLRKLLGVKLKTNKESGFAHPYTLVESEASIHPDEFSLRDLAQEFLGGDFVGELHNSKTSDKGSLQLREALAPVGASNFQDINAFNATVGGLIERQILEGYVLPEYIAPSLFETYATATNGGKLIGIPNLQLPDGPTIEGQEFPSIGQFERWVIRQPNVKYAMKLALTREAMVYDLTGKLMADATALGNSLGYVKEYWCAAVAQGVNIPAGVAGFLAGRTTNTFIYRGNPTDTPNATYQTAAGTGASAKYNYVNQFSNPLVDWTNIQKIQAKLNLMREFETGFPFRTDLVDFVVSPNAEYAARNVVHSTQILPFSPGTSTSAVLGGGTFAPNPVPNLRIYASNIWNKVLVDSGISQANADIYNYAGDLKKAFVWAEVWPMNVVQTNPLSVGMADADILNMWSASWYGVPVIRDPHQVINSTN